MKHPALHFAAYVAAFVFACLGFLGTAILRDHDQTGQIELIPYPSPETNIGTGAFHDGHSWCYRFRNDRVVSSWKATDQQQCRESDDPEPGK